MKLHGKTGGETEIEIRRSSRKTMAPEVILSASSRNNISRRQSAP